MTDAAAKDTNNDVFSCCPVCLDAALPRGGRPLYTPGCCGACWMHLECAYALPAADAHGHGGKCPLCRATVDLPRRSGRAAAPVRPPGELPVTARHQLLTFGFPPPAAYTAESSEPQDDEDRGSSIAALRDNGGEVVNSMMELQQQQQHYDGAVVQPPVFGARHVVPPGYTTTHNYGPEQLTAVEAAEAEGDIDLVMDQAHCTRDAAIAALRSNRGDLVDAIMELTAEEFALNEGAVSMVMEHARCTRYAAIAALDNNAGDWANAVMELTM